MHTCIKREIPEGQTSLHLRWSACGNRTEKLILNQFQMVSGRCLGDVHAVHRAFRGTVRANFQTQLQIEARIE